MKLISISVTDFMGRGNSLKENFLDDLNILTGKNGAGKTTLMKLVWYVMSGNIMMALREVPFKSATLVTDQYICTVTRTAAVSCRVEVTTEKGSTLYEDGPDDEFPQYAEDGANEQLLNLGGSLFLPTFRRIEGGFGISTSLDSTARRAGRAKTDIEDALIALATKLTNAKHKFVASISTVDIVALLLLKYTNLSDAVAEEQNQVSQSIIEKIKLYKKDDQDLFGSNTDDSRIQRANVVLDDVRFMVETMDLRREEIMSPLEAVKILIGKLFEHEGIRISNRLTFGDAATEVRSDRLSAGEKQMLSFICYNAFHQESVIFIDEPELSLHVDWQRQLFPILLSQKTTNQFVIATHSPFIYSKYPDKEICIDSNRGDGAVE
ncbi:AAA family ATPase [Polaromonas sp. P5_D5]